MPTYSPLSNIDLNQMCLTLINTGTNAHPELGAIFQLMYNTGCRHLEACSLARWGVFSGSIVKLDTLKGNGLRPFPFSIIPSYYLAKIQSLGASPLIFTPSQIEYYLKNNMLIQNIRNGDKAITTHVFRHNFARQLKANGYTDAQIQTEFRHTSPTSTANYIYDPLVFLTSF